MTPLLSLVVPVFNASEYIEQCFDSILAQSLYEFEVLVVDDGSTDTSLEICKKYAAKDNRIRVITQNNQGPGAARNNGIKQSVGKYLMFIDPDDWYPSKDTLKHMVSKIESSGYSVVGGSLCFYNQRNNTIVPEGVPKAIFHEEKVVDFRNLKSVMFSKF